MMLPGVELARRRRIHHHCEAQDPISTRAPNQFVRPTAMGEPAIAARIRLEEKLRGLSAPSSPSRWSSTRLVRAGAEISRHRTVSTDGNPNQTVTTTKSSKPIGVRKRTTSSILLCAVCLEEVDHGKDRIVRLPCSHMYHSDCVLPWLAAHPECPCCRKHVPPLSVPS